LSTLFLPARELAPLLRLLLGDTRLQLAAHLGRRRLEDVDAQRDAQLLSARGDEEELVGAQLGVVGRAQAHPADRALGFRLGIERLERVRAQPAREALARVGR